MSDFLPDYEGVCFVFLGKIAIALNSDWINAKDEKSESDREASDRAMQFFLGWYAHPIYVNGDYPEIMKQMIAKKSRQRGLDDSRLPRFTEKEKNHMLRKFLNFL